MSNEELDILWFKAMRQSVEEDKAFIRYHFAALVAAAEREACADILLEYAGRDDLSDSDQSLLKHLFDLIRARSKT